MHRAAEGAVRVSVQGLNVGWSIPAEAQVLVFLTGSKVGLGTPLRRIRDLFGPPLGLESCWGFAVSHASSTPWFAVPHQVCELYRCLPALSTPGFCLACLFSGFDAVVRGPLCGQIGLSIGHCSLLGFPGFACMAFSWAWILLGFFLFIVTMPTSMKLTEALLCFDTSLPYPCGCWTCFPIRLLVLALYSPRSLRRLDLCATSWASMGERTYHDTISNTKLLATMPCDLNVSSANAAVSFFLAIGAFVLLPFGRPHPLVSSPAVSLWYALFPAPVHGLQIYCRGSCWGSCVVERVSHADRHPNGIVWGACVLPEGFHAICWRYSPIPQHQGKDQT